MAVAFVQTQAPAWDNAPPATTSITVGSGANRALLVCVTWSGTGNISGVSSDVGGALSLVTGSENTTVVGGRTQGIVWYILLSPATGAHVITASVAGSVDVMQVAVTECTGVDQGTPYGTPVLVDTDSVTSINHVITGTAVGDLAISGMNNGDPNSLALTDITSGTLRWEVNESAFWNTTSIGGTKDGEAGTTTFTYNPIEDAASVLSGFAIKADAGAPATRIMFRGS